MKIVGWAIGGRFALAIGALLAQAIASESGEVVVLHTTDATGIDVTTRVWIVDSDGAQWLRAGQPGTAWYVRLTEQPAIRVQRGDVVADYVAVPTPNAQALVNALMLRKYGWRDEFIGVMIGGRDGAIPIRLEPRAVKPPN